MAKLDLNQLRELLDCDPATGLLTWKGRSAAFFTKPGLADGWNARWAGKPALASGHVDGYRWGSIFGKLYLAHRVVFLFANGEWPQGQVDHINGDRADNRIENLRDVTPSGNARNQAICKINTSGFTGVAFHKKSQRWVAYIRVNGKRQHIGMFGCKTAAIFARIKANRQHGYHENHGRAA